MIAGALKADPAKFTSKSAKSVKSRIGNIRDFLPVDMTLEAFWTYLKETLSGDGLVQSTLTEEELAAVRALQAEKYATWDWNYGCSPRFDMVNRNYFAGGRLEVGVSVEKGKITAIRFYGDFLSVTDTTPLCRALEGWRIGRTRWKPCWRSSLLQRCSAASPNRRSSARFSIGKP